MVGYSSCSSNIDEAASNSNFSKLRHVSKAEIFMDAVKCPVEVVSFELTLHIKSLVDIDGGVNGFDGTIICGELVGLFSEQFSIDAEFLNT